MFKDEITGNVRKLERIKASPDHRHLIEKGNSKCEEEEEKNAYQSDFGSEQEKKKYHPGQHTLLWGH